MSILPIDYVSWLLAHLSSMVELCLPIANAIEITNTIILKSSTSTNLNKEILLGNSSHFCIKFLLFWGQTFPKLNEQGTFIENWREKDNIGTIYEVVVLFPAT